MSEARSKYAPWLVSLDRAEAAFRRDVDRFISRVRAAHEQAAEEKRRDPIRDTFGDERTGTGAKRRRSEIDSLTGELFSYIEDHPGQRVEQIAQGMGRRTGELQLPLERLRKALRVSVEGRSRAMSYRVTPAPAPNLTKRRGPRHELLRGFMLDDGETVATWTRRRT